MQNINHKSRFVRVVESVAAAQMNAITQLCNLIKFNQPTIVSTSTNNQQMGTKSRGIWHMFRTALLVTQMDKLAIKCFPHVTPSQWVGPNERDR